MRDGALKMPLWILILFTAISALIMWELRKWLGVFALGLVFMGLPAFLCLFMEFSKDYLN